MYANPMHSLKQFRGALGISRLGFVRPIYKLLVRISTSMAIGAILVGSVVTPAYSQEEITATVQVPKLTKCSDKLKNATGDKVVGVITLFNDGKLGACTRDHADLRPLSSFPGGKSLNIKRVNQITHIQGSHCICVNGSCSC